MNNDLKFMLLVIGLPIAGLIYCGFGIFLMATNEVFREYSVISGTLFFLIPFAIASSIWIKASAKAYKK